MRTSREEDAQRELLYRDFSAGDLLYKFGPLPFISDAMRGFLADYLISVWHIMVNKILTHAKHSAG